MAYKAWNHDLYWKDKLVLLAIEHELTVGESADYERLGDMTHLTERDLDRALLNLLRLQLIRAIDPDDDESGYVLGVMA